MWRVLTKNVKFDILGTRSFFHYIRRKLLAQLWWVLCFQFHELYRFIYIVFLERWLFHRATVFCSISVQFLLRYTVLAKNRCIYPMCRFLNFERHIISDRRAHCSEIHLFHRFVGATDVIVIDLYLKMSLTICHHVWHVIYGKGFAIVNHLIIFIIKVKFVTQISFVQAANICYTI